MSLLRYDATTNDWVIFAPERARRPREPEEQRKQSRSPDPDKGAENEQYAAITPYTSPVPFETWILPKLHQASFGWVDAARLRPLAELLRTVLLKLYVGLGNPDFNLVIDTVSRGDEDKEYFLWHIQIMPRLTTPAGFELGSGMSINPVLPEDAAHALREAEIS